MLKHVNAKLVYSFNYVTKLTRILNSEFWDNVKLETFNLENFFFLFFFRSITKFTI